MATRRRNWMLALGLFGIFVAGGVTGALGVVGYVHHRLHGLHAGGLAAVHALGAEWLDSELDLSAEQAAAIEQILGETHAELFRFKSRHNDEILAIVRPALERIDAQLTPAQAERWSAIRARIVEHAERTADEAPGH